MFISILQLKPREVKPLPELRSDRVRSQIPALPKAWCLQQRRARRMRIIFGRWIPALVERIRTEEKLKELEPQVGVIQQGKHVRPLVIRACVSGPAPVTLGCSCYCVTGLPLAFSWATHSAGWPLDKSLHSLSLSLLICKMEIATPLCQLRRIALRIW